MTSSALERRLMVEATSDGFWAPHANKTLRERKREEAAAFDYLSWSCE